MAVVVDDRAFQAGLAAALGDFKEEAWAQSGERAQQIKSGAERRAPKLSGEGAASIAVTEGTDEEGRYIEVGTDVEHMFYQEFGTSRMPAHPFMRPSIAENSG